jgi:hypothetical protein
VFTVGGEWMFGYAADLSCHFHGRVLFTQDVAKELVEKLNSGRVVL